MLYIWSSGPEQKQGVAIFMAMFLCLCVALAVVAVNEQAATPQLAQGGVVDLSMTDQAGGNMEGKETRFGIATSSTWAVFTTAASNGSVNSMHDSYTPLGGMVTMLLMQLGEVIFGGVGCGLYKELDDAARMQAFTDIYDDSMWLINLVENLLAVTRIEGGQVELNLSIELLDDVIAEAMQHIDRHSKEHTIRVDSGDGLLLIRADTRLVVQLLINLVDNAIKYTPVGSTIEIRTRKKGSWAEVTVSDNGPGIPDEQKPRIFDLFYSATNRIVDSRRSLGLGLSLCKSIVSAHGGTISVADNHPQGTVFTFTLPAGEVKLRE